jgi:hypothetical protein
MAGVLCHPSDGEETLASVATVTHRHQEVSRQALRPGIRAGALLLAARDGRVRDVSDDLLGLGGRVVTPDRGLALVADDEAVLEGGHRPVEPGHHAIRAGSLVVSVRSMEMSGLRFI